MICCRSESGGLLEEVGVEVPETIDELEDVCDKLLEAGYVPFTLANGSKWTGSMYYMYLVARHSGNDEFNAAYAQEDGGSFTSDAFIWAGEKIQDWVEKGYFNEGYNSLTTDNGEDRALLYNNTCAMMLQGSWNVRNFVNDSQEWTDANLGVFRFPEDSPSLRITIFIILIISRTWPAQRSAVSRCMRRST